LWGTDGKSYTISDPIFSYDAPQITFAFNAKKLPLEGGVTMTLVGQNFGSVNTNPKAYVGPTACIATTWISTSQVLCTTPIGGAAQGFAWDASVSVGYGTGARKGAAIFGTDISISPFEGIKPMMARTSLTEDPKPCPCDNPPCKTPTGVVNCDVPRESAFFSCPPDFKYDLLGSVTGSSELLTVVSKNGVVSNNDGVAVSSTGTGVLNQRLFSVRLGQFLPDATYKVTLAISGDFQMTANLNPRVTSDLYFGIGNGKNWVGVQKADPQGSVLTGSMVQGTYGDLLTIGGSTVELAKWPAPGTATPQSATMTLTVKKNSQDKIVASIIFKHGDVTTAETEVPNFSLIDCTGAPLPSGVVADGTCYLEAVAFRKSRESVLTVKNVALEFVGIAPACGSN